MSIESRLLELGIILPKAAAAAANYVPFVKTGNLIFIAGQIPILDGKLCFLGQLGNDLSIEDGYSAARLCGLNLIAQASQALDGDLDRVRRVVKLGGFVNATPAFKDHPKVINGASDLMVAVFGAQAGSHARAAVGCSSLPLGVAIEVDGIIEVLE